MKAALIEGPARAITEKEGLYVGEAEAQVRGIRYPTRAQGTPTPGNIRSWKDASGRPYPTDGGYVDFVAWAVICSARPACFSILLAVRKLPRFEPSSSVGHLAEEGFAQMQPGAGGWDCR